MHTLAAIISEWENEQVIRTKTKFGEHFKSSVTWIEDAVCHTVNMGSAVRWSARQARNDVKYWLVYIKERRDYRRPNSLSNEYSNMINSIRIRLRIIIRCPLNEHLNDNKFKVIQGK